MQRGPIGHYRTTIAGGEEIRAFLPLDLPPNPPLEWPGDLVQLLSEATIALARLDGISHLLPDKGIFLYSYVRKEALLVRKEALLSSQIEGTQSSLSDLLLFELAEAPGALVDDVTEVSNYVAALEHGLARLKEGFPYQAYLSILNEGTEPL